jgi:hypothetical protein
LLSMRIIVNMELDSATMELSSAILELGSSTVEHNNK